MIIINGMKIILAALAFEVPISIVPGNCALALHEAIVFVKSGKLESVSDSYFLKKDVVASCEISEYHYLVEFRHNPVRHDDGMMFWISKKDFWIERIVAFRGINRTFKRLNQDSTSEIKPKGITF